MNGILTCSLSFTKVLKDNRQTMSYPRTTDVTNERHSTADTESKTEPGVP